MANGKPPAKGKSGSRSTGKPPAGSPTTTKTPGGAIPAPSGRPKPKITTDPNATSTKAKVGGRSVVATQTQPTSNSEARKKKLNSRIKHANALGRAGGVGISREYTKNLLNRKMQTTVSLRCMPTIDALANNRFTRKIAGGKNKDWICSMEHVWRYREEKYAVQNNEYRLFINGVEVTHYVQGTINWTLESTGGMNTCRFTLNNTQDAFILTPENLCAGTSPSGWRLNTGGKVRLGPSRTLWRNFAVDETAKFLLYKQKYDQVMKDQAKAQIDAATGMWLYPLGPYRCIVHKHDPVRLFIRLPNTSGASKKVNKKYWKYGELWAPAFTGFVKEYSWDDHPDSGTRTLGVTCYDYRGLLARMRVRIEGLPQEFAGPPAPTPNDGSPKPTKGNDSDRKKNPVKLANDQFLIPAMNCGKYWRQYLLKAYPPNKVEWPKFKVGRTSFVKTKDAGQDERLKNNVNLIVNNLDPYKFMEQKPFDMVGRLKKLWKNGLKYYLRVKYKCITEKDLNDETFTVAGNQTQLICVKTATKRLDQFLAPFAVRIVQAFAYSMLAVVRMWQLRKDKYQFYVGGTPDIPKITFKRVKKTKASGGEKRTQQIAATRVKAVNDGVAELVRLVEKYINTWRTLEGGGTLDKFWDEFYTQAIAHRIDQQKKLALKKKAEDTYTKSSQAKGDPVLYLADLRRVARNNYEEAQKVVATDKTGLTLYRLQLLPLETEIENLLNDTSKIPRGVRERFGGQFVYLTKKRQQAKPTGNFIKDNINAAQVAEANSKVKNIVGLANVISGVYSDIDRIVAAGTSKQAAGIAREKLIVENKIKTYRETLKDIKVYVDGKGKKALEDMLTYLQTQNKNVDPPDLWGRGNAFNLKKSTQPRGFPWINGQFAVLYKYTQRGITKEGVLTRRGSRKLDKLIETWAKWRNNGKSNTRTQETTRRVTDKYADFTVAQAGIFADLVESNKGLAHPLMGKTFEEAVAFLTTGGGSQLLIGGVYDLDKYSSGVLRNWNRLAVFGVIQRPITYQEVSAIGQGSRRFIGSYFSPINAFVHFLRPLQGTGAASIVQTNTASGSKSLTQAPTYETRKSLLDKICQGVDYQFYVSPMGDLVFEIPNYNAFPEDFGPSFRQAYEISKDWISSTISEESSDVATAYKFSGQVFEKKVEAAGKAKGVRHRMQHVYMWHLLARRIGVQQQDIVLQIPGVGDPTGVGPSYLADPEKQLEVFALFYMQRQLGRMHTLMVRHPFRPYLLPNRPIWLIPRQRIGLPQSVSHSMSAPDGVCTTESQLIYTREMFRDGTFRFVGGGQRQPIDYVGFLSGDASYKAREGVGVEFGYGAQMSKGSRYSRSQILNRLRQSSNFSSAAGATFGTYFKYKPPKTPKPPTPKANTTRDTINMPAAGVMRNPPDKKSAPVGNANPLFIKTSDKIGNGMFYSGWKTNAPRKSGHRVFSAFGYLRNFSKGQYQKVYSKDSRGKDRFHGGLDIMCDYKTLAIAPIHLQSLRAVIMCGCGMGKLKTMHIRVTPQLNNRIRKYLGYSQRAKYSKNPMEVFFSGKPKPVPFVPDMYYGRVWSDAWARWNSLTDRGRKGFGLSVQKGSNGIFLIGFGWIRPPFAKSNNERLWAKLIWVHLDDLHGPPGQKYGADITGSTKSPIVPGTRIAEMYDRCSTGSPHLHFEVYVRPGQGTEDTAQLDLFKKLHKLQREYLETQLVAMARGWRFEAGKMVNPNNLDGDAADYWQRWGKRLAIRKNPKTGYSYRPKDTKKNPITVKELVAYFKRRGVWKKYGRPGLSAYILSSDEYNKYKARKKRKQRARLRSVNFLRTNPAWFFKCKDLLDISTSRGPYRNMLQRYCLGKTEGPTGAGYRPGSDRGGGSGYTPPPLAWCASGLGRQKAGGKAKATQARSSANSQKATDPSKAKSVNKKLKKNLDKAGALQKQINKANKQNKNKPGRSMASKETLRTAKLAMKNQRRGGMADSSSGPVKNIATKPKSKKK